MKKEGGWSASITLYQCDKKLLKDPGVLRRFAWELCRELKMHRVGTTQIRRFGHNSLRGYSLMQFIQTSTITAHFDEQENRAFIDIFSCKKFNARPLAKFCRKYFHGKKEKINFLSRQ